MSRNLTGWTLVIVQALLLLGLLVLPGQQDWPTPSWLHNFTSILVAAGVVIVIVAAVNLGWSLTPSPVPSSSGSLRTTGLFRFVRHPIYTGVLLIIVGLVTASGSLLSLGLGVVAIIFFVFKARWEEAMLSERFDAYQAFAQTTPRFIPRPFASLRGRRRI